MKFMIVMLIILLLVSTTTKKETKEKMPEVKRNDVKDPAAFPLR